MKLATRLVAFALAGLLSIQQAGAAFYAFGGNAFTFSTAGQVQVPNVVGQANAAAADAIFVGAGLVSGIVTPACSSQPLNQVTSETPPAGTFVASGSAVDITTSNGIACWSLVGIPTGWYTIPNVLADKDFAALMRQEASGDGIWAYWLPGAIHNSANLRLNMAVIRTEATSGGADWARWDSSGIRNSDNLQLDMRGALTVDFQ